MYFYDLVLLSEYKILDLNSCMYSDRPMYHALGYGMALICIMVGSKLVVDKKFNLGRVLEAISQYKVSPGDGLYLNYSSAWQ